MQNHLLRVTHEAVMNAHYYQTYTKVGAPLIIFIAASVFLIIMAICFINNSTNMIYEIPISSPSGKQKIILVIAIILLIGSGLYSIIVGAWSHMTWYYFGAACIFFALFLWMYQTGYNLTLLFSTLFMVLVAASCYLLSIGTIKDSSSRVILTNIVGGAQGWALIWALYVLSQFNIYKCDISRKSQTIFFFIVAIALIIARILAPSFNGHIKITDHIGFLIMTIILLIVMFDEQRKSLFM